eukprot:gene5520-6205_t
MESVNFVCKYLGTTLHTNVIASDGYEIENLLAEEGSNPSSQEREFEPGSFYSMGSVGKRNNGFMTEYFVKPPVDIVVQFPCLVDIDCLVVNCRSGEKKISQFDVSTAQSRPVNRNDTKIDSSQKDGAKKRLISKTKLSFNDFPLLFSLDISSTDVRKENVSSLNIVSRFNAKYSPGDVVVVRNPRNARGKGSEYASKSGKQVMNFFSLQYLSSVSHLVIRVYRTEGSTVVAMKRLEVWGVPSRLNDREIKKHVYDLVSTIRKQQTEKDRAIVEANKVPVSSESRDNCMAVSRDKNLADEFEAVVIPEEFLDQITFDVMVLPMLLPSGHTVDATTLEKCEHHDRTKGRMPGDPFTGIQFTDANKPVPNTSLKSRLDKFMLENDGVVSSVTGSMGHTIGTKQFQSGGCGGTMGQIRTQAKRRTTSYDDDRRVLKRKADDVNLSGNHLNRNETVKELNRNEAVNEATANRKSISNAANSNVHRMTELARGLNHEDSLKNSLEAALKGVSTKLPMRKQEDAVSLEKRDFCIGRLQPNCCNCKVDHVNDVSFYKLPCHHIICRNCIFNKELKQCTTCSAPFRTQNLERVHLNAYFGT